MNLAEKTEKPDTSVKTIEVKPQYSLIRPNPIDGKTYNMHSGCCDLYVTVNHTKSNIYEVFVCNSGVHGGGCTASLEGLGRMISISLQNGVEVKDIVHSLSKIVCPACIKNKNSEGKSCPGVVAKCLDNEYMKLKEIDRQQNVDQITSKHTFNNLNDSKVESIWECPECHSKNVDTGGCKTCKNCGYSKCG